MKLYVTLLHAIEYSNLIYLSSIKELVNSIYFFIMDINFLALCQFDIKMRGRNLNFSGSIVPENYNYAKN